MSGPLWSGEDPGRAESPTYAPWPGEEPVAVPRAGRAAGWWPRVGAAVIDTFIRIALALAGLLVGALLYLVDEQAGEIGVGVGLVIGFALGLAYAPWMIARTGGQTYGHRSTDTRIVRQDGSALTGGSAAVREVAVKWLLIEIIGGFLIIPTLVNYLWPLLDEDNHALHDKICSTRVVEA